MTDTHIVAAGALRIGVIDADTGFVQVLTKRLERLGWNHLVFAGGVPIERLVAMRLGAVVVDLTVLGPDAWSYLERVTRELPALPVVVCTGQSTVAQRVRGLRLGADDWVTKPCHPEELIARVEAVARRRQMGEAPVAQGIVAGEIEIRPDQFQAFALGRSIDLTRREFELIQLLASAEGRVLERERIYERVWGYTMAHGDRSVDVFVRKLRLKLQRMSPDWTYIHTHFGVGYRFAAELAVQDASAIVPIAAMPPPRRRPPAGSRDAPVPAADDRGAAAAAPARGR